MLRKFHLRSLAVGLAIAFYGLTPSTGQFAVAQTIPEKKLEVRGVVLDAKTRQPVANADVVVLRYNSADNQRPIPLVLKTDATGHFKGQVEEGHFHGASLFEAINGTNMERTNIPILVHAPGFALQGIDARVGENEIILESGLSVAGKVIDSFGKASPATHICAQFIQWAGNEDALLSPLSFIDLQNLPADNPILRSFETLTNADGTWIIRDLPPESRVSFNLNDPRFINQFTSVSLAASVDNSATAVEDMVARPGSSVIGRVLLPNGKPVANAQVNAQVEAKDRGYAEGRTAADGTFSLSGLPMGKLTIQVKPPSQQWAPAGVTGITIMAQKETLVPDITFAPGIVLNGTITDAATQKPLEGARIIAYGPFGDTSSGLSDANGHYSVRANPGQNRFYVTTTPQDYLRADVGVGEVTRLIATTSKAAPDFALKRGVTLTGTAVDEAGQPAAGATISTGIPFSGSATKVDDQGNWTLRGVDPRQMRPGDTPETAKGSVYLKTTGKWQIVAGGNIQTPANGPVKLTLRRTELQDVTVRVTTPNGAPVPRATLSISILFDSSVGARRFQTAMTDAHGEFVVHKLRSDESAEVTPSKEGFTLVKKGFITPVEMNNPGARSMDAVMSQLDAFVQGQVIDAQGTPVAGALIAPLYPGDLRNASLFVKSDEQGRFRLEKLQAGETMVGAALGRDWGQTKTGTGKDIEIKLTKSEAQPVGHDVERAFDLAAQWMDEDGPKLGYELIDLAAHLALVDRDRAQKLFYELGDKDNENLPRDMVLTLVRREPKKNREWAREQIELIKDPEQRRYTLLQWATNIADIEPEMAQKVYDSIAPTIVTRSEDGPQKDDIYGGYLYATLEGLAGRLKHADAEFWREALIANVKQLSADERMFRIGGYAGAVAVGDTDEGLQFVKAWEPALQVRALEDVIPIIAERSFPVAQQQLARMEAIVNQPDLPVEAPRNDAMYRPTPAHSLDMARIVVLRKLLVNDPTTAFALTQKLSDDGYGFGELKAETAAHLPKEAALPALREAFEAAQRIDYNEATSMARVAALTAQFDPDLSREFFQLTREKLAPRKLAEYENMQEDGSGYAFYLASTNPAQSRLLLENQWQRVIASHRAHAADPAQGGEGDLTTNLANRIIWAMAALDFERAFNMLEEVTATKSGNYSDVNTRRNLIVWLLATEEERRLISFDQPRSEVLDRQ